MRLLQLGHAGRCGRAAAPHAVAHRCRGAPRARWLICAAAARTTASCVPCNALRANWHEAAFAADGSVQVRTGKVELGQGIRTALAQIAADELGLAIERVQVLAADTAFGPDEGVTSGSLSVQDGGSALRAACIEARTQPPRTEALVGRSVPRTDLAAKFAGAPSFIHDLEPPGLAARARAAPAAARCAARRGRPGPRGVAARRRGRAPRRPPARRAGRAQPRRRQGDRSPECGRTLDAGPGGPHRQPSARRADATARDHQRGGRAGPAPQRKALPAR